MVEYKTVKAYAIKHNKRLRREAFRPWATVKHIDGSCFLFYSAFLEVYKERFVITYSEHHPPFIFFAEDLSFAGYGIGLDALDNLVTDGWYVYMAYMGESHRAKFDRRIKVEYTACPRGTSDICYIEKFDDKNDAIAAAEQLRKCSRSTKDKIIDQFKQRIPRGPEWRA